MAPNDKPPPDDDRPARKSSPVQEIIEPDPTEAAYNDPTLSPKDFLMAVFRDKRLPMAARIDAATKVSVYEHPRLAQVSQDVTAGITIRIEGGLPALPGTNIIMPGPGSSGEPNKKTPGKGNGSAEPLRSGQSSGKGNGSTPPHAAKPEPDAD